MAFKFFDYIKNIVDPEYGLTLFNSILQLGYLEDLGPNANSCLTTDALSDKDKKTIVKGHLFLKSPGIICGLEVFEFIFNHNTNKCNFEFLFNDGSQINDCPLVIAKVETTAENFLKKERLALNIIQHMSGIATQTKLLTDLVKPFGISIRDTRKTLPGLRIFEKYAVTTGNGINHRQGLYDKILIKDNHIKLVGSLIKTLEKFQNIDNIQIEIASLDDLNKLKKFGGTNIKSILLDNMKPNDIRKALDICQGQYHIEVSGGITPDNLKDYLIKGIDTISIGYLTHSPKSLDYSLKLDII